ncbi:DegT/DnrJ/EryC1/StrS family aminotransferase [Neosynechococcus sphagnicola]|uniref:DegT/DnrJ/EryC1/StrS family aminotransferase n=1 Tax=Neosynechococcus sphagnicola TaxID=1501145 RepID=UPI000689693D|nr:DegT/DnrJ/EryC1/StrS family aminotransferase [Neosynechococcus sphagnicola]
MTDAAALNPELSRFTIGFDPRDRDRLHQMWDEIFNANRWSEGAFTHQFEQLWQQWNGLPSVAFSSWAGAAMACLDYLDIRDKTVLCPANTFMATPLSVVKAGGKVQFVDCNRHDLCMSYEDFVAKAEQYKPAAAWLVHIGGHLAFEVEKIAEYCRAHQIWLLEDCAHAHGAEWNGQKPGSWGDAGVYSFYATKTISTGEGGMLVTRHPELAAYAQKYRNYGKFDHVIEGLNYRLSEFTAAIGCVQTERMPEIVAWKQAYASQLDRLYPQHLQLPAGMKSGYYKYIVFEPIERSTGKVYDQPCHRIMGHAVDLPNTDWVAENHWCVPIYYHGGSYTAQGQPLPPGA